MKSDGLDYPTEYEIISAMMYEYFYQEHVDFAIVEVAMGGQNDCTNVMDHSILSMITPISLDHTGFLGDTVLEIAKEKSGVVKNNSVLISHPQDKEVMDFLKEDCQKKMTVFKTFTEDFTCDYNDLDVVSVRGFNYRIKAYGSPYGIEYCWSDRSC